MGFPRSLLRVTLMILVAGMFLSVVQYTPPVSAQSQSCALNYGELIAAGLEGTGQLACTFNGKAGDKVIADCDGCSSDFISILDPSNSPIDASQPLASSGEYTALVPFSFEGGQMCSGASYPSESSCGYGCVETSSGFSQQWCPADQVVNGSASGDIYFGIDRAFSGVRGSLIFSIQSGENSLFSSATSDIYRLQPNGYEIQLTREGLSAQPDLSPDGSKIAYVLFNSPQDATGQIYVADAKGNNPHAITSDNTNTAPVWSPDSTQILFMSNRNGNDFDVDLIDADGSNLRTLTHNSANDRYPRWSPDGKTIYFHSDRSGGYQIYAMSATGSNVRQLTTGSAEGTNARPIPSPDGTKIVFDSDRDQHGQDSDGSYSSEVYVMNVDGSNQRRITNHLFDDFPYTWSPDSTQIVYYSDFNKLMVMNADGTDPRRIAMPPGASAGNGASWISSGSN